MDEVTVQMPLLLTGADLKAIRSDELSAVDDKDEMNMRLGWFICAYDAVVAARMKEQRNG